MTIIIDTSGDEPVARSNLQVPADAEGQQTPRTIITVDSFLEGERQDSIQFVLDERFRDRVDAALQELIERGENVVFEPGSTTRDLANAVSINLASDSPSFVSIVMKHDVYREEQVTRIVNRSFRELV